MRLDVFSLINAIYSDGDVGTWLDGLVESAREVDRGFGVGACVYDLSRRELLSFRLRGLPPSWAVDTWMATTAPKRDIWPAFRSGVGLASDRLKPLLGSDFPDPSISKMTDVFGIVGTHENGYGAMIAICEELRLPPRAVQLSQRRLHELGIATAHLGAVAQFRLSRSAVADDATIFMDAAGKVVHATGEGKTIDARTTASRLAKVLSTSTSPHRRLDRDHALAMMQQLLEGEWSLCQRMESDGRRLLIARRSTAPCDVRALSHRERQVVARLAAGQSDKETAFELGITPFTAASHVRNAMLKLGLSSRSDLIKLVKMAPAPFMRAAKAEAHA